MLVNIGIHQNPKPGKEAALLESMRKFGEAQRRHEGLIAVYALKDEQTGALIGLAVWDTDEHYQAARSDMAKAIEDVNFDELESSEPLVYHAHPATPV